MTTLPLLDSARLGDADATTLRRLAEAFDSAGFSVAGMAPLTGKQVTRYVNISPREENYLRTQVLHRRPQLLTLVDLFLLSRPVTVTTLLQSLPSAVVDHCCDLGILVREGDRLHAAASIAPLARGHVLNDGSRHLDDIRHVLPLVLEQAYIVHVCRALVTERTHEAKGRALDICCGSGVIGLGACPDGWSLLGLDINPRAVDYARFNANFRGCKDARFELSDIRSETPEGAFDLILSNPPYNAYVPPADETAGLNITLHADVFGDGVTRPILNKLDRMLATDGTFMMIGIMLLKDGWLWHPRCAELAEAGTLIFLHQPISDALSWEGLRLLYNCTPDYEALPAGAFEDMIRAQSNFDQVAWGIVIYRKGGTPGYHHVYNLATDGILVNDAAMRRLIALFDGGTA